MQHFDMIVIGSGPAGQSAAVQATKLCKKVAIVEKGNSVGGACLHTGTIPSKTLRAAVLYLTGYNLRGLYGKSYRLKHDLTVQDLMQRLNRTVDHEMEIMRNQLYRSGVQLINGEAHFEQENTLSVTDAQGNQQRYTAEKFVIATGTVPFRPDNVTFDGDFILDSDHIAQLKRLPRHLVVVGAGVIGIEYASMFSAMDIKVTLVDGREQLLDFLDHEIIEEYMYYLRSRNVSIRLGEKVVGVEKVGPQQLITTLESGKVIYGDMVLFASGRTGSTHSLNLENVGFSADDKGRLQVNDHYQTQQPHIYAAGDVIGFPSLASTSMEQGRQAAAHAFGQQLPSHAKNFPFAIYGIPEISMVGLTEKELTSQKIPFTVGIARFSETARGQIKGITEGFLKMLVNQESGEILGVHILGEESSELIHIGQAVMVHKGNINYFLENIFNYPTLGEVYKMAALDALTQLQAGQIKCYPTVAPEAHDIEETE
ncbi:MAG: Si-specific NAD(P)(+) transhydrogenase [Magnetococcales bacterium]|nr:Si-specific NAD(P)(+) transhydrogenase [Magnetococcales bacterium]